MGVPTVKSPSKEERADDMRRLCSKALKLFLEEFADLWTLGVSGLFACSCSARKNLWRSISGGNQRRDSEVKIERGVDAQAGL